jgi:hypothetical protein
MKQQEVELFYCKFIFFKIHNTSCNLLNKYLICKTIYLITFFPLLMNKFPYYFKNFHDRNEAYTPTTNLTEQQPKFYNRNSEYFSFHSGVNVKINTLCKVKVEKKGQKIYMFEDKVGFLQ